MFLKVLLITIVFLGLAFVGIAVKMFLKKDGEFKKSCSTVDPNTGQKLGCVCGDNSGGNCDNKGKDVASKIKIQPLQAD